MIIQSFVIESQYIRSLSSGVTAVTKLDVGTRAQARRHTYTEDGHTHLDGDDSR